VQQVTKSVLVPYAASQMFELVDRIELYPQFLPWCAGATVLAQEGSHKTARLDIAYHGVRSHFTTDNANRPPDSIIITLKDGPFRHLHGEWRFRALGEHGCKVEFNLAYEFATALLDKAIGPVFNHIASTFIEAFVRRADAVHAAGR
jgi:ribosome-associated toxin RatA of RatAB toxin-antitoxin module